MSSSFGKIFTLTTYGESHGIGLGGIVDGCPAGLDFDEIFIQEELNQRKPGSTMAASAGTSRKEPDIVEFYSGVYQGKTTGSPIGFHIKNTNQKSSDYNEISSKYRPSHADYSFDHKYGFRDPRGGGRSSGRETVSRVVGGAIAQLLLNTIPVSIHAVTLAIDGIFATEFGEIDMEGNRLFGAPNSKVIPHWEARINEVRLKGDSVGGLVRIEAQVPTGLGEPVFNKLDAALSYALMGVGAVKGIEFGSGFRAACMHGSVHNDAFYPMQSLTDLSKNKIAQAHQKTNNAGGILGGISTGQPIIITIAIKPIASISIQQDTIDIHGKATKISIQGRHDICAIPRIIPVLKAMTALTLADMLLLQRRMSTY